MMNSSARAMSQMYPNKRPRTTLFGFGSQTTSTGNTFSTNNTGSQAVVKSKSVDVSEDAKQKRLQAIQEALAQQVEEEREQAFALKRMEETGIKKSHAYYDKLFQVHIDEYRRMKSGPRPRPRSPSPDPFKVIGFHPLTPDKTKTGGTNGTNDEEASKTTTSVEEGQATLPMDRPVSPTNSQQEVERTSFYGSGDDFFTADTTVVGFTKASLKSDGQIIEPSKAALEMAEKRMQKWSEEQSIEDDSIKGSLVDTPLPLKTKYIANEGEGPVTPQRPASPRVGNPGKKSNAFKSPLISKATNAHAGPSNLSKSVHPLASTPITSFTTPVRPAPSALKRALDGRPKFETPFKAGMRPEDSTREALLEQARAKLAKQPKNIDPWDAEEEVGASTVQNTSRRLAAKTVKYTLRSSGLRPQQFTASELESYGIEYRDLKQITPQTAPFYAFNLTSPPMGPAIPASQAHRQLTCEAAYNYLTAQGCKLITKDWVQCQWSLILWKLAGMACLDPTGKIIEGGGKEKWAWEEVKGQLRRRYKHEFEEGKRPALRLIAAGDASPATPMVVCVTNVTWKESHYNSDGVHVSAHPTIEVTDGWYRLRARVDEPLGKACLRLRIRIGTKLAVLGARLDADHKDGQEILQAYDNMFLVFNGNGTHLAPWYAKLGFQKPSAPGRIPFLPTMGSLTGNGGVIPLLDLAIEKVHPIGFFEYETDEDGNRKTLGPFTESEEAEEREKWISRREKEALKIRDDLKLKWSQLESFAGRLERAAGQFGPSPTDSIPDHIGDLFDDLESTPPNRVPAFIRQLSNSDAGWLARFVLEKVRKEKENLGDVVEKELAELCPHRVTSSFRIIIVRDAFIDKKPAHRSAQLTVWDVLSLTLSEGAKPGSFEPGQRYLMTNIKPIQVGSWAKNEPGAEIYLCTRKDTRITRLK